LSRYGCRLHHLSDVAVFLRDGDFIQFAADKNMIESLRSIGNVCRGRDGFGVLRIGHPQQWQLGVFKVRDLRSQTSK